MNTELFPEWMTENNIELADEETSELEVSRTYSGFTLMRDTNLQVQEIDCTETSVQISHLQSQTKVKGKPIRKQ